MIVPRFANLIRSGTGSIICRNEFHTSSSRYLDQRWRQLKKLPSNPISYGPLTNDPDYTFKDGRPTPYGTKQMRRIEQQREYIARMMKLNAEIDYAVERHARLQKEAEAKRLGSLDNELKPKGKLYKPLNKS